MDDIEAGMKRSRLELKQTLDFYNTTCREAPNAKQKIEVLSCTRHPNGSPLLLGACPEYGCIVYECPMGAWREHSSSPLAAQIQKLLVLAFFSSLERSQNPCLMHRGLKRLSV